MDDDATLVERVRDGDEGAYAVLVDRYQDAVFGYVRQRVHDRATANDVAQEAFVTAFYRIGELREPGRFCGFCLGIAKNLVRRTHRYARRPDGRLRRAPLDERVDGAGGGAPADIASTRETHRAVREAIGGLDHVARAVVTLRFLDQRSYPEIAACLGLPLGTVSSTIHRALARLRPRLAALSREVLGHG